jgi:site-specific DNA recombinase
MANQDLRVAIYARVSGEQQAKEDTIASQLEAVSQRIASDAQECDPELRFVDDGYSGSVLARPGLERLRDQAAAGAIDRLYMLDPDRLSRKYAYQVLLLEELDRCGVEVVFLRNPVGRGPEADLLLQVQGMIAEYERAKIMERCRRGKQHAARRGSVNVLSGAPYGYRYIGKHEGGGEARYRVLAEEARVVRKIFEWVGHERCSIGEVCRRLRRDGIPTRTGKPAWDRATVWLILKNPAYKGTAAFGKTRSGEFKPQRLRPQRGRPEQPRRPISRVDTSSEDQILIEVPGLVSEDLFGAVQAQLEENRQRRRDRPGRGSYLLQGLVVCKRCGYGCYGKPTSRAASRGKGRVPYAYYRCTGSDAYRFGGQRLCWNKQIRTDMLDAAVWDDVRRLLSEPERVRSEYERRLQGARTGPNQEVEHLTKLVSNVKKMISRLIDAYGEGLLDKSEFEPRISAARARLARLEDEHRQRIGEAAQEAELRLVIGQLEEFASRVSQGLQEPDWTTRREVVRALVKRVEVDEQEVRIVYRVRPSPFEGGPQQGRSQHCWGREGRALWATPAFVLVPGRSMVPPPIIDLFHRRFEPHLDQSQKVPIADATRDRFHQLVMGDAVEVTRQVRIDDFRMPRIQQPVDLPDGVQGAMFGPIGVLLRLQVGLEDRLQDQHCRHLRHAVSDRPDAQRPLFAIRFGDENTTHWLRSIRLLPQLVRQFVQPPIDAIRLDVRERLTIDPRRATVGSAAVEGKAQDVATVHLVVQQVESVARRSLRFGMQRLLEFPNLFRSCEAHANLPALMLFRTSVLNSGPFAPPELPGFTATTSPSATPVGPACPSRASG